jgi:translation initiation factor 3 subunit C
VGDTCNNHLSFSKIQEEGLRTYLFMFSPFYDALGLEQLAAMFDLPISSVHAVVSKMIINEELHASLDQPSQTIVLHRAAPGVEMSKLEYLAGVYSEKVSTFVDNNEKLLENRSISLGLQQQQSSQGQSGSGSGSNYKGRQATGAPANKGGNPNFKGGERGQQRNTRGGGKTGGNQSGRSK